MKEAQGQLAGVVGQPDEQAAPAPEGDVGNGNLALDDNALPRSKRAQRYDPSAVFVALGKQEQQVQRPFNAESRELFRYGGADTAKGAQVVGRLQGTSTASASTAAPRGSDATPMAARAG